MPIATFLILAYYSPDQFRFIDEFQHVQTAQTILSDPPPVSRQHLTPGEPAVPGARDHHDRRVVAITHLSITTSGMIVTGVAHVLVGVCLYFLVLEVVGSPPGRGVRRRHLRHGTALSVLRFIFHLPDDRNPVPPALASGRGEDGQEQRGSGERMGSRRLACGAVTVVSHHITSYALVAVLFAFVIVQPFLPRSARSWRVVVVFRRHRGHGGGVGPRCRHGDAELHKTNHRLLCSAAMGYCQTVTSRVSRATLPVVDSVWEYASTLLLVVLALLRSLASVEVASGEEERGFPRAGIGALSIFIVLVVRVASGDGSELAGRAMSFALIPICIVAAAILIDRARKKPDRPKHGIRRFREFWNGRCRDRHPRRLGCGGIAGGWPSYYARLPGPYRVSAYERSVDQHNLDAAMWAATALPRGGGVASDDFTESMFSALGNQAYQRNLADLFLTTSYTKADRSLVRDKRITYVVADKRITEQLPGFGLLLLT